MSKSHVWDYRSGSCSECGITQSEYLNAPSWDELFCPGSNKKPNCCTRPSKVFLGGKWVCETCDKNDTFMAPPKGFSSSENSNGFTTRECTCGARFRGTPDKHYIWCDLEID